MSEDLPGQSFSVNNDFLALVGAQDVWLARRPALCDLNVAGRRVCSPAEIDGIAWFGQIDSRLNGVQGGGNAA